MRRCALCLVDYPDAIEFCPSDGAKLPPVRGEAKALRDPLVGSTIDGRYFIDAVIGEGGMGLVYSARHAIIDKRVAIKVLRKEAAADESSAHRFLAEAKAASKIDQRNIVDITDFGVLPDGHAYFVMELLDGITLGRIISKQGPMTPAAVVSFAIQVARGLSAAHGKGIIHRDLKPENIFLLERDGIHDFVKIVDFGIARDASSTKRVTVAGMVMGTPEYMAPEQASGQETDHRVDQYALACMMYEALTGSVPFAGENSMQTLTKHVFEAVQPPSVRRPDFMIPPPLEAVIMKSLQKNRDDRYADMDAMMRGMQAIEPEMHAPTTVMPLGGRTAPHLVSTPKLGAAIPFSAEDSNEGVPMHRSRMPLFIGTGVVVLAVGIFALMHGDSSVETPKPSETPVVATPKHVVGAPKPVVGTPKPVEPPLSPEITLALASIPTGADVYLGDAKLGVTPTTATHARGIDSLHFVFKHVGFKDGSRDVTATEDAQLVVTLARDNATAAVAPAHPTSGTTGSSGKKGLPTLPEPYTLPVPAPSPGTVVEPTPAKPPDKPKKKTDLHDPFAE
ncbi:MAG: serine/threonine-protein kinase [Polyangia bacterium]